MSERLDRSGVTVNAYLETSVPHYAAENARWRSAFARTSAPTLVVAERRSQNARETCSDSAAVRCRAVLLSQHDVDQLRRHAEMDEITVDGKSRGDCLLSTRRGRVLAVASIVATSQFRELAMEKAHLDKRT